MKNSESKLKVNSTNRKLKLTYLNLNIITRKLKTLDSTLLSKSEKNNTRVLSLKWTNSDLNSPKLVN